MKLPQLIRIAMLPAMLAAAPKLHAAAAAFDEATDSAYSDGWGNENSVDPGHTGFSEWSLEVYAEAESDAYTFMGDSTSNGGGGQSPAWGLYAKTGDPFVIATRDFTSGNAWPENTPQNFLGEHETFSITLDFGLINPLGTAMLVSLQNSDGEERISLRAQTDSPNFKLVIDGNDYATGVAITNDPIVFSLTALAGNNYIAKIGAYTFDQNSTGYSLAANDISRVVIMNFSAGTSLFATSMVIVPEPATASLLLLGLGAAGFRRRRA